ncbi:MAG: hypothetical protein JSV90_03360 [Methanobacteriota archaeon]|nr:MAG: hypothetical protein JSV90_03360 [Euryarchaeota archaeon]
MKIIAKRAISSFMAITVVCLLAISGASSGKQNGKPFTENAWTVAIYVCADNNLEPYWGDGSLAMLLNIPQSESVEFIAYVDIMSTSETQIVEIDGGEAVVLETLPEKNFGDGATFQWFLEDVSVRCEAENLAVIAWDHGGAWRGFCHDSTSGDQIRPIEMREAIVGAGVDIDILGFDACMCACIETAYEAAASELVDLMVASEELVDYDGFPYDLMFTPLALDPEKTAIDVAFDMVDGWAAHYSENEWAWFATLGVIDVSVILDGIDAIDDWTEGMLEGLPEHLTDYKSALRDSSSVSCVSHYQADMVDLGRHLLALDSVAEDTELAEAIQTMMDCIDEAILYVYNPERKADSTGLSILWAIHDAWSNSAENYALWTSFAVDTSWPEFLTQYNLLAAG